MAKDLIMEDYCRIFLVFNSKSLHTLDHGILPYKANYYGTGYAEMARPCNSGDTTGYFQQAHNERKIIIIIILLLLLLSLLLFSFFAIVDYKTSYRECPNVYYFEQTHNIRTTRWWRTCLHFRTWFKFIWGVAWSSDQGHGETLWDFFYNNRRYFCWNGSGLVCSNSDLSLLTETLCIYFYHFLTQPTTHNDWEKDWKWIFHILE